MTVTSNRAGDLAGVIPTQADVARLFGVSTSLVSRLYRGKVFRRGDTLAAVCQAFLERAVALAEGAPSSGEEFEIERTALYRARRQLAETELAQKRGELVSVKQAADTAASVCYAVRVRIWAWQSKLPGLLAERPAPQIARELEREAFEVLSEAEAYLDKDAAAVYRYLEQHAPADLVPAKASK